MGFETLTICCTRSENSSPGYPQFYAPWCGYCKKLEPIWHEVGVELKSSGSPVRVGKMDATAYSGESATKLFQVFP